MSQSYPWIKLDHVSYRHGEFRAKASMQARYAYHELITIAPMQTPSFSIPNDDAVIAGWLNISVKQWLKVRDLVLSQFTQGDDGRFYCNMLVDVYSNQSEAKQENANQDNVTPRQQRNAERQKRYRERNANRNGVTPESVTRNDSNVTQDVTRNATVTPSNVTHRNEMGGKGGDLDLDLNKDLDKEQELKTKTTREASVCDARFDEFWIQYPRKENKQGAIKAFKKLNPSEKLFEEILLALSKQKSWTAFQNGYAPHAATWLNAKRWEDQAPINQSINNHSQPLQNGTSSLMESNRRAVAEAKIMLFGNGEAA